MEVEPQTLKKYFEIEDMKSYLKNVFGIEDADLSAYYEGDKVVLSMVWSSPVGFPAPPPTKQSLFPLSMFPAALGTLPALGIPGTLKIFGISGIPQHRGCGSVCVL